MGELVEKAQTCVVPSSSIHDDLHLICYTLERVNKIPGKSVVLVHLDLSKPFDRVAHWYLVPSPQRLGFAQSFAALYSNIDSIVLLETVQH